MTMDDPIRGGLAGLMRGSILFDEPASRHASLALGGTIDALAFPQDEEEIRQVVGFLVREHVPYLPVGNWTNLIVRDGGYRGVLISLSRLRSLTVREAEDRAVVIEASAGCPLSELVALAVREGAEGLEFAAGIPGSVGGGLRMNAGAYGGQMADVVESARILDGCGTIQTLAREMLHFSYRNLDLPAETIIIGAAVHLRRGPGERIEARIREIIAARREKHPLNFPNAGSIFRNPKEVPAGKLIEEAGLKGTRIGGAEVSEKHGNFIVNRGGATAEEILGLIALVQRRVLEKSGHRLETEVKIIGERPGS
jgi:UDP-N-acetylmuramate dehydrogenase